ncbi:MAG: VWA domain-containing protein [Planctomycetes bacterium]|nr:VWA domain-containing protein [Planctomycetota bacterium]MCH9779289.1 VWA domain-containing protein [Planctomycetota bacterium]MCH9789741.1 VWA domain-containing protein [Planctomycetota bacterium]
MRKFIHVTLLALISFGLIQQTSQAKEKPQPAEARQSSIELAILLDTSGSMEGLINQARSQLWKIVNELATARQNGKVPVMKVALYEYGKSSLPASEGYLRQIMPLTENLDQLSEELFALKTNGGEEYCGQVIQAATNGLNWSDSDESLKLIFIAGNEPFTQGKVDYKVACPAAIKKGIAINTIFCGPEQTGIQTGWKEGALLADGSYLSINQGVRVVTPKTPYDKKLSELSRNINKTYLFYGSQKAQSESTVSQQSADKLAGSSSPASEADRASFKGSGRYRAKADLLDAIVGKKVKLEELKEAELPAELKKLSKKEQVIYVEKKQKERKAIQLQIQQLTKKRNQFIAEEMKKKNKNQSSTFDTAVIKALKSQAVKKNFQFQSE